MNHAGRAPVGFERHWRFRARPGREGDFEVAYGASGVWAGLFSRATGYRGTSLEADPGSPGEYRIVDRWESRVAWEEFLHAHGEEYEKLDRACADLTAGEELVQEINGSDIAAT